MPTTAPEVIEIGATTAHLHAAHHLESGLLQQTIDRVTRVMGWPGCVVLLTLAIVVWVLANLAAARLGLRPPDPPPFDGLQAVTSSGALVVAGLILTTQRREDRLAEHRSQLILELSISNDQKIAKIVGLLEESRRDNPAITNRIDDVAAAMSMPSDAAAVLEVIKELGEG